jgi:putative ABC transport system permease protein
MSGGVFGRGGKGMAQVVRSGVSRRRTQTLVMTLAALMAVGASVAALALLVASSAPFNRAFSAQHGPDLVAQFDTGKVTDARIAATERLPGVTTTAGPYAQAAVNRDPASGPGPGMTLVGRSSGGGALDDVTMYSGHWVTGPGQIVISSDLTGPRQSVGGTITLKEGARSIPLTVVGIAKSVVGTADGWVTPDEISTLVSDGAGGSTQLLYRFSHASSAAQLSADRDEIVSALPSGAVTGTVSYLDAKQNADQSVAVMVPFVAAFGVLGLFMSVLVVGSVVSGSVSANLRRVGVLKAIGCTPGQVARAYLAQALIPTGVGVLGGVLLGNLLAIPLLHQAEQGFGTSTLGVPVWVDIVVPCFALLVVAIAALIPALRAARLRTNEVIALGRAPRSGRGRWAHRLAEQLPLPRPVTIGLATPFTKPARAVAIMLAVVFGATAVSFAVGLTSSLTTINDIRNPDNNADVVVLPQMQFNGPGPAGKGTSVTPGGPGSLGPSLPTTAVGNAIAAQPGTAAYYGDRRSVATVAGMTDIVQIILYSGDATSGAFQITSGHWLSGPGQVVVTKHFLDATGTKIGDSVTTTLDGGVTARLTIVGTAFDLHDNGLETLAEAASFGPETAASMDEFQIAVKHGTDVSSYVTGLNAALSPLGVQAMANPSREQSDQILMMDAMASLLTIMLVIVAALGVLNAVVVDTRERVHDIGVCKAIGMTPRQTLSQVVASVFVIGVAGGVIGVPVGMAVHGYVLPAMGRAADSLLPADVENVYHLVPMILLGIAGVCIAILGALLPASWAAKTRAATALRTE